MTITSPIYVGIDVSKDTLEATRLGKKPTEQFANTKRGIAKLVRHLKQGKPKLIVMEATGGYEETAVWALFEAGLPVALVGPQRVRQYARARGCSPRQIAGLTRHDVGCETSVLVCRIKSITCCRLGVSSCVRHSNAMW